MSINSQPRGSWWLIAATAVAAAALCGALAHWPGLSSLVAGNSNAGSGAVSGVPVELARAAAAVTEARLDPILETLKLVVAALIGLVITVVQRRTRPERPASPSMEQAQVLLAVSGALMMVVIGNSLARAFGIAGAASIVRFRTPVDDPRDVTVLFLLMGLGMAAGLGALSVAALGTVFLACCLVLISRLGESAVRCMKVAVVAEGSSFPAEHVEAVFARYRISLEPLELTTGDGSVMRYKARLARDASLEELSAQLLNGGSAGIKSISWESPRKAM
jgi:Domain of unknown function (DUF4956)